MWLGTSGEDCTLDMQYTGALAFQARLTGAFETWLSILSVQNMVYLLRRKLATTTMNELTS